MVLGSLDMRDVFLTVTQERPNLVHTTDASEVVRSYALGTPWKARWKFALVSRNHQLPEDRAGCGRAEPNQRPAC